jgi:hypothetical protein
MTDLRALVAEELSTPVEPRVGAMAEAIAAKYGPASRSVLFYGSCLRERELDGRMLDFYLIVANYRAAYGSRWLAAANRLIPPNVFYFEQGGLAAKYAVLSEADFAHECSHQAWTVSTAARFAQPSRLVWAEDNAARGMAIDTVAKAAPTLLTWAMPLLSCSGDLLDFWREAFVNTFAAEIRAEDSSRAAALVDADPERYRRFGDAAFHHVPERRYASAEEMRGWWRRKQLKGKLYSIARLAKASFTFAGGAEYIAWKINRHAGTNIELKPWQRRHPLLAGLSLLPKLLRGGAIR